MTTHDKERRHNEHIEPAGAMTLTDRVLMTERSTLALAQIARVEVSQHSGTREIAEPARAPWLKYGLIALPIVVAIAVTLAMGSGGTPRLMSLLLALAIGCTISGGIWVLMSRRTPRDQTYVTHTLNIVTSDGHQTSFSSENESIVENAFLKLTERLNGAGGRDPVTISFTHEAPAATARESRAAPSLASPRPQTHGNANGARTRPPDRADRGVASSKSGSVQIEEGFAPTRPASASPFAQQGPARNGTGQTTSGPPADAFVDFSSVLPAIVEMHRFYARQPGAVHLEQRLSELELLMRAGTPTASQKARLKELSVDMSQILQAYPQAVQLFDHVGGLAA